MIAARPGASRFCRHASLSRDFVYIPRQPAIVPVARPFRDEAGAGFGPCWTTSRLRPARSTPIGGSRYVNHCRAQDGTHNGICHQADRYRLTGSPGRDPDGTHQEPDRPFQVPYQGQSFASGPSQDGLAAPFPARLSQGQGRGPLQDADREARHPPLIPRRLPFRPVPMAPGGFPGRGRRNGAATSSGSQRRPHGADQRLTRLASLDAHGRIAERSGATFSTSRAFRRLAHGPKARRIGSHPIRKTNPCSMYRPKN